MLSKSIDQPIDVEIMLESPNLSIILFELLKLPIRATLINKENHSNSIDPLIIFLHSKDFLNFVYGSKFKTILPQKKIYGFINNSLKVESVNKFKFEEVYFYDEKNILETISFTDLFSKLNQKINKSEVRQQVYKDLEIDYELMDLRILGNPVNLTLSEFYVFSLLYKNQGTSLSRIEIASIIQNQDLKVTGRSVDTHIYCIRRKIHPYNKLILSIRGYGYKLSQYSNAPL